MVMKRIIPCLDVKDGKVVKGIGFDRLRVVGDPVHLARRYYEEGADELVFLDISAGVEGRRTVFNLVEEVARHVFIPLTVGGGVRRVEDVRRLLLSGCDKVAVNSAAVRRPELVTELAERFGSQCVVLAVDVRSRAGEYEVVIDAGRTMTGVKLVDWLDQAERLGAGEVLLTSIDRDGTGQGYDVQAIRRASESCRLPLIASGGMGRQDHIRQAFLAGADAVLAASIFHSGQWSVGRLKQELLAMGMEVRAC